MTELIVIGGSAGAFDAVLALIPALPDELALPIVLVLHQQPHQKSLVPALLAPVTRRTVREVEDKDPLAAGTIHIAPPNYHLLVERDRTLALSVDEPVRFSRPSIDVTFESAAVALGGRVLGVMLSGANDDGARGLRRIVESGGLAIIQDPATVPYAAMPRAALDQVGAAARVVSGSQLATAIIAAVREVRT
jgi:two-component system chemotaxis response regulator CheB